MGLRQRARMAAGICLLFLLVALAAYWTAMRRDWMGQAPQAFAFLVALELLLCAACGGLTLWAAFRREIPPLSASAQLLALAGLLAVGSGGMANWLFSLQGYAILTEGEAVPLESGSHLQAFEFGPLSDFGEMRAVIRLLEFQLQPAGEGFRPTSRLSFSREGEAPREVTVGMGSSAQIGTLRFHQGAFGYAPRIVVLRGEKALFDEAVPFTTSRRGLTGVSFEGEFTLAAEGLRVSGAVSLESLDEKLRGHPTLLLEVARNGKGIGSGSLLPGRFADLDGGYRVGFAGLKEWSEIDISRKNYPLPIYAGLGLIPIGLLLWSLAAWRKW